MPSITFTLPVSGTVITAGLHANNLTLLQTLLNGGLDTANWASGRIFAPSKIMQEGATDKQTLLWDNANSKWAPAGDWQTYAPAWSVDAGGAPVLGNGTLTGRYVQIGKVVHYKILLTPGTTTTFGGGTFLFSLPVTASTSLSGIAGGVTMVDSSASQRFSGLAIQSSSNVFVTTMASPVGFVAAAVPFTWASADTLSIVGAYEAA